MDRILMETDAPYVAPMPYRGKRNEPVYVIESAKKMAELKGVPYDKLEKQTTENVKTVFGI
jgi:TatD DNase family protein